MSSPIKKYVSMLLVMTMIFSTVLMSESVALAKEDYKYVTEKEVEQLKELFYAIETMPDDIIESGDVEAAVAWINQNTSQIIKASSVDGTISIYATDWWGCINAVGIALLSNSISLSKIAKVKSVIQAAGGVNKFMRVLLDTYDIARSAGYGRSAAIKRAVKNAAKDAGPEVTGALLDFFHISNVLKNCFG